MKKPQPRPISADSTRSLVSPPGTYKIGWKEFIGFPEWGLEHIKAKIDTGARTSALDVHSYRISENQEHGWTAEIYLALDRRHPERLTIVRAPVLGTITVANSAGMREERPFLETTLRVGPVQKRILVTLTNRSDMLFRMILGRKALEGMFVVDVSQKYLLGKRRPRTG